MEFSEASRSRFLAKCERVTESGCWIWTGASGRYGNLTVNKKHMDAHRASWLMHNGSIDNGLFVLHRCDVKLCVNPAHLFLGTNKDNAEDLVRKGRYVKRFRNPPTGDNHWKRRRNSHVFP